jgi:phage tail protein X
MEGTSDCESCIAFTGGVVEAVLAAVTGLVDARAPLARGAEATGVSEV